MNKINFIWDDEKAAGNIVKHNGVTFEEASSVFYDDNAILFDDPEHSEDEDRFLIIGMSNKANILLVSHCYREPNETIRIISARTATNNEAKQYEEINRGW